MIAQLHRLGVQQLQPSIEAILSHGYRDRLRDSTIREQGICLSPGINSLQEAAAERAGSETTVWLARSELNSEIRYPVPPNWVILCRRGKFEIHMVVLDSWLLLFPMEWKETS